MRMLVQRVSQSRLSIGGNLHASIGRGLLVFLGIEETDGKEDLDYLAAKLVNLRIFADSEQKMNLSVKDIGGEILLVSQFTLHASTKKGNRPSFIKAAPPQQAEELYKACIAECEKNLEKRVSSGVFGADMQIELLNDGPVTIWMDSKNKE